jgi:molybdenum cofactor cytidylyltransferase
MVARVVDAALESRLDRVLVVVGHEAAAVRAALRDRPVDIVDNPLFAAGLSTSVHAAIRAAGAKNDGGLFLLADQPFVTSALINRLLDAFAATGKSIVRPELEGQPANPVLFSAALFPEMLQETGDRGGRNVIRRHEDEICRVQILDSRLCVDIDSLQEYEKVVRDEA